MPNGMPCERLTEEEVLDFGFFSLSRFPDPKRFTHEIMQDETDADIVQVRFTKKRKPFMGILRPALHIIYRLDRAIDYRVVGYEQRVGKKLARRETFTYMDVDGQPFLKTHGYVEYDQHGREEERGTWTIQSVRLVDQLPDTAFQLERKRPE